jgi:hypothetical protein
MTNAVICGNASGSRGRQHSLTSVLSLVVMAVLRGRTALVDIMAWIAHAGQDLPVAAGTVRPDGTSLFLLSAATAGSFSPSGRFRPR